MTRKIEELTKDFKWLNKMLWTYYFGTAACFSWERMMAPGIVNMLIAAAPDLYPNDPQKQKEMVENHLVFYNTQPNMGIVPGTVLGLEIERSKGADIPNEVVQSVKAALAGPFAGIGDALIQGMLVPIILSIGMGLSSNGSALGGLFVIFAFFATAYPISFYLFKMGINLGVDGAEAVMTSDLKDRLIDAVTILGCTVVGAVTAQVASKLKLALVIKTGGMEVAVESYMNQIFPGLTVLIAFALTYYFMRYKNILAKHMIWIMLAVAAVGYFTGIL
ncbi:MAG: PTS system mannose/fructose/sorbose family transporter subunit IID [Erysipelotrichaceae bacterium]|nr:PTS system mannose/fructose/sorbose family transporter subunit IID [Erysipelotrichaceae bacterium]MDD4642115.1 PTS system mannose/fructose/sorbose family transporter subunit IID [Erysipelotrichaceae bacterium]